MSYRDFLQRHIYSNMKSLFIVSCLHIVSLSVWAENSMHRVKDWTLADANEVTVNYYADSHQSVSVILFWATWCPYCRSLMPHLQAVADEYKNRQVKFYALNVWEDGDPQKYFQENGFTFRLLLLADLVAEDYGVKGTPGLFVMDQSRQVLYIRQSGEDDVDVKLAVREAIQKVLPSDQ